MKTKEDLFIVVAVKDELTNTFLQPTFQENEKVALRIFKTQINSLPIWKENPADFSLYKIGYYDQETGKLISEIEKITSGHSLKEE